MKLVHRRLRYAGLPLTIALLTACTVVTPSEETLNFGPPNSTKTVDFTNNEDTFSANGVQITNAPGGFEIVEVANCVNAAFDNGEVCTVRIRKLAETGRVGILAMRSGASAIGRTVRIQ